MKYIVAVFCVLLSATCASAMPSNNCAEKSEKLQPTEREAFMKSCLAQVAKPEVVKEAKHKHKSALCEQNAKNKDLKGNDKANYQANCLNKNDAAVAASAQPQNTAASSPKAGNSVSPKNTQRKSIAKKQQHKKNAKKDAA